MPISKPAKMQMSSNVMTASLFTSEVAFLSEFIVLSVQVPDDYDADYSIQDSDSEVKVVFKFGRNRNHP